MSIIEYLTDNYPESVYTTEQPFEYVCVCSHYDTIENGFHMKPGYLKCYDIFGKLKCIITRYNCCDIIYYDYNEELKKWSKHNGTCKELIWFNKNRYRNNQ